MRASGFIVERENQGLNPMAPDERPFNIEHVPAENRPKFWLDEITGHLKPVVERYYRGDQLTDVGCALMRAYLAQWIESPVWDESSATSYSLIKLEHDRELRRLRRCVKRLRSSADIREWLIAAADLGIEPL